MAQTALKSEVKVKSVTVALAVVILFLSPSRGAEGVPFGAGPILKAPKFSWTISVESSGGGEGNLTTSVPILRGARMKSQTVTKNNELRRITSRFENDAVMEIWVRGIMAAQRSPDYPQVIVRLKEGLYSSDFPEFDWLSAETYMGEVKRDGRALWKFSFEAYPLRFRDRGLFESVMSSGADTLDLGRPVPVEALIDTETRLPVELKVGNEIRRYQFASVPDPALALPQDVEVALGDIQKRFDAISRPLSRP